MKFLAKERKALKEIHEFMSNVYGSIFAFLLPIEIFLGGSSLKRGRESIEGDPRPTGIGPPRGPTRPHQKMSDEIGACDNGESPHRSLCFRPRIGDFGGEQLLALLTKNDTRRSDFPADSKNADSGSEGFHMHSHLGGYLKKSGKRFPQNGNR